MRVFRARRTIAVVVLGASVVALTGVWPAHGDVPPGPPVCDSTTVVAHLPGGVPVPDATGAPQLCRSYTGYPGGESRIEVTNGGAVLFSPAPYLRGAASLGYGPDQTPDQPEWMFQNGGIARSTDHGTTWSRLSPGGATWTMDDAFSYYDRRTNKYFWVPLNSSPFPQSGLGPREQGVLTESRILSSDDDGTSWAIGSAIGVISDRAGLVAAPPPVGQPIPSAESGGDVVYYCHVFGTNMGTCSRSLDGGRTWTVTGRSHGVGVHAECAGAQESTGRPGFHTLAGLANGTVLEVFTCNGQAFLAGTTDEGATWPTITTLPHSGDLRVDDAGNLYLAELVDNRLLLSSSSDGGMTWRSESDVTAPGIESIQDNWYYAVRHPGEVTFTYEAKRTGATAYDGFITATRPDSPLLWSAQVNDPTIPLMYSASFQGIGYPVAPDPTTGDSVRTPPPQNNQLGAAIGPEGDTWASFTEDCGATPQAPRCEAQHNQTRGLAAWLAWP